jgi:uncharacterized protein
MPIVKSKYIAPFLHKNEHFTTIYSSIFRKVKGITYTRETIEIWDGDFLDLDWSYTISKKPVSKLAIITHGLLGSSDRQYVKGSAKALNNNGYDVLAWNHRGLGGKPNRFEKMTTHGGSDDLAAVINHAIALNKYSSISLVGWSKGGNIAMKYAGELGENIPNQIKAIVAISSPPLWKRSGNGRS